MKKQIKQLGITAVIFSILLFAGCTEMFNTANPGMGSINISVGNDDDSRTLFPNISPFSRYRLVFEPLSEQNPMADVTFTETTRSVDMEAGLWKIIVIGEIYISDYNLGINGTYLEVVRDSKIINVASGESTSVIFDLFVGIGEGEGFFDYSGIVLPSTGMTSATLRVLNLDGEDIIESINLISRPATQRFRLDSDFYILHLEMVHTLGRIGKVEVFHIYPAMTTKAEGVSYTFIADDFQAGLPVPKAPANLSLTAGINLITVNWDTTENAKFYEVQYREEGEAFKLFENDITKTNAVITNLKGNTQYYVRVRGINNTGVGAWSDVESVETNANLPAAPSQPIVTAGSGELSVSWNAVENAIWYEVWYRVQEEGGDGKQFMPDTVIAETNINITELENGVGYQVRILAGSYSGKSAFSAWSNVRIPDNSLPPATPMPEITNISNNGFTVTWQSVPRAEQYQVWLATENSTANAERKGTIDASASLDLNISELEAGTIYYVWIRAQNSDGSGAYSPSAKVITTLSTPNITNLTTGKQQLAVNWSEVSDSIAYDIYISTNQWDNPSHNAPAVTLTNETTSYIFTELNPTQTYHVWVRAKRISNGEWVFSNWSNRSQGRVPNSDARFQSFVLYHHSSDHYYVGQIQNDIIRVNMRYSVSFTSAPVSFSLSQGARTTISNGGNINVLAPLKVTVTAEDNETITEYTIIATANTPIQINFARPEDEQFDVGSVAGKMTLFNTDDFQFKMISVQNGITFPVGTNDAGREVVPNPYQIGETTVTWELWNTIRTWAVANGYSMNTGQRGRTGSGSDQQPVTMVTWYDAKVWCNALTEYWNEKTGAKLVTVYNSGGNPIKNTSNMSLLDNAIPDINATGFRLPTNNEWELAARWQGQTNLGNSIQVNNFYFTRGNSASGAFGDVYNASATQNVAIYTANSGDTTAPVKSRAPNALGLFDMSGNVWERCTNNNYLSSFIRGGSFNSYALELRIGEASQQHAANWQNNIGFRIVRNITESITTSNTLELSAPTGYESYKWIINNIDMGSDTSLILDTSNPPLTIGPNSLTLIVYKKEEGIIVPYSKTVTITVLP